MGDADLSIRPARPEHQAALLALALRLTEGLPAWRDRDRWAAAAQSWVRAWAARDPAHDGDQAVYVAIDAAGRCAGFVDVAARRHFTGDEEACVGELVVAAEAEGKGVGTLLMRTAEDWARQRGLSLIGLDASAPNARARRL